MVLRTNKPLVTIQSLGNIILVRIETFNFHFTLPLINVTSKSSSNFNLARSCVQMDETALKNLWTINKYLSGRATFDFAIF